MCVRLVVVISHVDPELVPVIKEDFFTRAYTPRRKYADPLKTSGGAFVYSVSCCKPCVYFEAFSPACIVDKSPLEVATICSIKIKVVVNFDAVLAVSACAIV